MEEFEKIKAENFEGIKNQFLIYTNETVIFQSYESIIAVWNYKTQILILGRRWDYSNTTSKYLKRFINNYTTFNYDNKKQLEKLIKENNAIIYDEKLI